MKYWNGYQWKTYHEISITSYLDEVIFTPIWKSGYPNGAFIPSPGPDQMSDEEYQRWLDDSRSVPSV